MPEYDRPAPDTILSSPAKTCGNLSDDDLTVDENRRSPDILPSLTQIIGGHAFSDHSVSSRDHVSLTVLPQHDHHERASPDPSHHVTAAALPESGGYDRYPQQASQHRELLGIGVPPQHVPLPTTSRDRLVPSEESLKTEARARSPDLDLSSFEEPGHVVHEVVAEVHHHYGHVPADSRLGFHDPAHGVHDTGRSSPHPETDRKSPIQFVVSEKDGHPDGHHEPVPEAHLPIPEELVPQKHEEVHQETDQAHHGHDMVREAPHHHVEPAEDYFPVTATKSLLRHGKIEHSPQELPDYGQEDHQTNVPVFHHATHESSTQVHVPPVHSMGQQAVPEVSTTAQQFDLAHAAVEEVKSTVFLAKKVDLSDSEHDRLEGKHFIDEAHHQKDLHRDAVHEKEFEHPYHNSGSNSAEHISNAAGVSGRTEFLEEFDDSDDHLATVKEHPDEHVADKKAASRQGTPAHSERPESRKIPSAPHEEHADRSYGDSSTKVHHNADPSRSHPQSQSLPSLTSSNLSSVNRDYTFHKCRVWPGIVTMTLDHTLPAAKTMVLFNNENPKDAGYKFVLTNHAYRNWGQVLDEWTRRVQPKFGKITRVFTPIHGREVSDIDQLKDNAVYIVGGGAHVKKNPRFPPARRVDSEAVRKLFHREPIIKNIYRPPNNDLVRRSETLPPLEPRKLFDSAFPINVFRNGDLITPAVRVMLKGFDLYNMQKVMDCVGQKVTTKCGGVRSIITIGGRQIHHVKDLIPNGYYVALGLAERFIREVPYRANGVHEDFIKPKIVRHVEHRVFKAPPRDVRLYPISNLLQMSDTSLVNCGFLPQNRAFSRKPDVTRSTPDPALSPTDQPAHYVV